MSTSPAAPPPPPPTPDRSYSLEQWADENPPASQGPNQAKTYLSVENTGQIREITDKTNKQTLADSFTTIRSLVLNDRGNLTPENLDKLKKKCKNLLDRTLQDNLLIRIFHRLFSSNVSEAYERLEELITQKKAEYFSSLVRDVTSSMAALHPQSTTQSHEAFLHGVPQERTLAAGRLRLSFNNGAITCTLTHGTKEVVIPEPYASEIAVQLKLLPPASPRPPETEQHVERQTEQPVERQTEQYYGSLKDEVNHYIDQNQRFWQPNQAAFESERGTELLLPSGQLHLSFHNGTLACTLTEDNKKIPIREPHASQIAQKLGFSIPPSRSF